MSHTAVQTPALRDELRPARRRSPFRNSERYMFLLPVALSLLFFIYNVAVTFWESLRYHILAYPRAERFVGLENYAQILRDPMTGDSLRLSVVWVVGTTLPTFILGFLLALLLNQKFWGRGLYRALVLSPWAISGVVGALAWSWILNGPFGVLNDALIRFGITEVRTAWLSQPSTAMAGVLLSSVWRGFPFFAITLLAGLQSIPPTLYEAAKVDGASTWQSFWFITLPLLRGVILMTTLLRAIWAFQFIENIFLMTYGGPASATTTWAFYLFQRFFDAGDIGYTAAMNFTLFVVMIIFTVLYLRAGRGASVEGA